MKSNRVFALVSVLLFSVVLKSVAALPVSLEIDAEARGRKVNPYLYGINTAHWDESLFPGPPEDMLLTADRDAITKIRESGVTLLKYPGGNAADSYIWNAESNAASQMDTDEYMALCRATGAEPFITVNFNASPELAAEWVRYCNVEKDYNVKLWEIGDEQWGTWARGHGSPETYAEKLKAFVAAMRAVDPSIQVAMNVPLGSRKDNWTERTLKVAGAEVDMLTFTYFPLMSGKETDEQLLASSAIYRKTMADLRQQVEQILGAKRASEILYVNLGYNSVNSYPGPQTLEMVNALFTADLLGSMAETGTDIGCFWALHNAYPPRGGDYGYLSSDEKNTPSYSYYVFPMFVNGFGDEMLAVESDDPALMAYASRDDEKVAAFLINKDPKNAKQVMISLHNFKARQTAEAWILDESRRNERLPDISVARGNLTLELPPYSFVAVNIRDAGHQPAPANLAREATATASSVSTIGPNFGPEGANDGLTHTRWESEAWTKTKGDERQWIQLEWEKPQVIASAKIHWGASFGTDYRLEYSIDGSEWHLLKHLEKGTGGTDEFSFAPVKARFLRMNGQHGTSAISAYAIEEFEAFEPETNAG